MSDAMLNIPIIGDVRSRSGGGGRLAQRARSFKDDIIEKISHIRSPSATRSASPTKCHHKGQHQKWKHNKFGLRHSKGDHQCHVCSNKYDNEFVPSFEPKPRIGSSSSLSSSGKQSKGSVRKDDDDNHLDKDTDLGLAFIKQLTSALRYFHDVVEKNKLEQLSGSASIILEIIILGYSQLKSYLINYEQSSLIISSTNKVYQSLAQLIRWSDSVLISGDNVLDKESVRDIVKNVNDAVTSLVEICINRHHNQDVVSGEKYSRSSLITNSLSVDENCSEIKKDSDGHTVLNNRNVNPNRPAPIKIPDKINSSFADSDNNCNHRNSLPEIPLSPRERVILESTNFATPPPLPFRDTFYDDGHGHAHHCPHHGTFIEHLNHSVSSDSILESESRVFGSSNIDNGFCGRPLSINESKISYDGQTPPPLPPKKRILVKRNHVNASQTSIDFSSHHCSKCPSSADSIDSCLNLSCHLSADDILSVSRTESKFDFEEHQIRYKQSESATDVNPQSTIGMSSQYSVQTAFSNTSLRSYEFSLYSHTSHSKTTKTQTSKYNGISNRMHQSNSLDSASPPPTKTPQSQQLNHRSNCSRIDDIINQMKTFNTSLPRSSLHDEVDGPPPQLPVKMRPKNPIIKCNDNHYLNNNQSNESIANAYIRPPSLYDNLMNDDELTNRNSVDGAGNSCLNSGHGLNGGLSPIMCSHSVSCPHFSNQISHFTGGCSSFSNITSLVNSNSSILPLSSSDEIDGDKPPPLPPKRRNIMAYMQAAGSYNGPVDGDFYRHSVHTYRSVQSQWNQVEMTFMQQRSFYRSATSSDDSVFSFESESGATQTQTPPPPVLPPKKNKNKTPAFPLSSLSSPPSDAQIEERCNLNHRASTPVSLVPSSESGISSQSELTIHMENESDIEKGLSNNFSNENERNDMIPKLGPLDEIEMSRYIIYKGSSDDGPDIRGGPKDALIVKATEVSKNDFMFQEAFLTTYRTFLSPSELITKLLYRYNKYIHFTDIRQRAARNAFALLVRVVNDLCVGDTNDELMQQIMDFIYQLVNRGDLALAKVLRTKVIEKIEQKEMVAHSGSVLLPSISVTVKQSSLLDFKSDHLAEQMTLLDSKLFLKIEIPEVLIWAKEQKEELIPNLNTFTEHFNKMSYWVRSRILELEEAKDRERLVLKFLKIMKYLRKLNNFNSYLAILSALDSAPIRRLEWQRNITEGLKEYSALIDSSSSFRTYRQALAETEPPCIPYIGLILQDLTFVHIGNNDYLPDGNINFSKRWQQYNILDQMRRFKNCHYSFKTNEQIIAFFNNFDDYLSEEAMWQISESIKPRGVTKK